MLVSNIYSEYESVGRSQWLKLLGTKGYAFKGYPSDSVTVSSPVDAVVEPSTGKVYAYRGSSTLVVSTSTAFQSPDWFEVPVASLEAKLSEWLSPGADATAVLRALVPVCAVDIDTPITLSGNIISNRTGVSIRSSNRSYVQLNLGFDTAYGALELTGNNVSLEGIVFVGNTDVTPVRLGNPNYGVSGDTFRRVGIKVHNLEMQHSGFKGPNHGNLVVIGALSPEITACRFHEVQRAGGNLEILGCDGGFAKDCYAENGLLINFHGTSAAGTGFPTTNFGFINCVGVMNNAALGSVDGAVGGNNNLKFSRNCTGCYVQGGKFTSIAAGSFNGNDSVIALQGSSNCTVSDVWVYMQGNGVAKRAFDFIDHSASLTGSTDNIIKDSFVQINTPGTVNRICNVRSDNGQQVRRNTLRNIRFNCYNGSNTVDAIMEQYSGTTGMVSDNVVQGCYGLGVTSVLRNRTGLGSTASTYLEGNRIGTNALQPYTVDTGRAAVLGEPMQLLTNGSGNAIRQYGLTVSKTGTGTYVITFPVDVSTAGYSFSSPGTGRYIVVTRDSSTQWTVVTYNGNNPPAIADLQFSLTVK